MFSAERVSSWVGVLVVFMILAPKKLDFQNKVCLLFQKENKRQDNFWKDNQDNLFIFKLTKLTTLDGLWRLQKDWNLRFMCHKINH